MVRHPDHAMISRLLRPASVAIVGASDKPGALGASVLGAIVGIVMKLTGSLREGRYVPFGPFLAGAGLVCLLAGHDRVMGWMGWY